MYVEPTLLGPHCLFVGMPARAYSPHLHGSTVMSFLCLYVQIWQYSLRDRTLYDEVVLNCFFMVPYYTNLRRDVLIMFLQLFILAILMDLNFQNLQESFIIPFE